MKFSSYLNYRTFKVYRLGSHSQFTTSFLVPGVLELLCGSHYKTFGREESLTGQSGLLLAPVVIWGTWYMNKAQMLLSQLHQVFSHSLGPDSAQNFFSSCWNADAQWNCLFPHTVFHVKILHLHRWLLPQVSPHCVLYTLIGSSQVSPTHSGSLAF